MNNFVLSHRCVSRYSWTTCLKIFLLQWSTYILHHEQQCLTTLVCRPLFTDHPLFMDYMVWKYSYPTGLIPAIYGPYGLEIFLPHWSPAIYGSYNLEIFLPHCSLSRSLLTICPGNVPSSLYPVIRKSPGYKYSYLTGLYSIIHRPHGLEIFLHSLF